MYETMTAPILEPVGDAKVALQSVNIEAEIENLLCEVTIKQVYSNLEKVNIEAVYTFPLPLGAVLLDMTIKTKTKELRGVVIEKSEAENRYEDAVTDGDTAIMLEQADPGMYTMNVGNLQPEDTIEISITYAELFKWRDNSLRFFMPTTIAPRYGDPESVGIQPHQTPEYDLTADNQFAITISFLGELADASFKSPSHRLDVDKHDGKTVISLKNGEALMDRDFVLNIIMETEEKSFAIRDRDFDGHIALASFYPKFPDVSVKAPRCITIIVDCSGSMGGDSIAQARKALQKILEDLRPQDNFNLIRFGDNFKKLFTSPRQALSGNLKKAMNLLENLDADMGGTEIGGAITAAIKSKIPEGLSREILLITDGEVYDWEKVTTLATKSGFRFFTVGVGSSVSEAFVQTLADATGGACELVSPHEDMAEKIVRHFKRIYFPRAEDVKISWPCESDKVFPAQMGNIYDGDTLHVFGRFQKKPDGNVTLTAKLENGEIFTQRLPIRETSFSDTMADLPGTTARMAAAYEIRTMDDPKEIAALGVKYQLMSRYTNYLAIEIKAESEKAGDLPALRKTPQMLAAGWGGSGTVLQEMSVDYMKEPMFSIDSDAAPSEPMEHYSTMSFEDLERGQLDHFIDRLNRLQTDLFTPRTDMSSINDLVAQGVPQDMIDALVEQVNTGFDEQTVVVVFLYLLSQQKRIKKRFTRSTNRILTKAYKQLSGVPDGVQLRVKTAIESYFRQSGADMASEWSQDIYISAYRFSAAAHWNSNNKQLVPGTGIPYLMHFSLVAMEVIAALEKESGLNGNLAVQCALLHDTIEDTETTYEQLVEKFGRAVADGVQALTKDKAVGADLQKQKRKECQMADSLERIQKQPREIWTVKMADRVTNLQPPPKHWTAEKINRYREEAFQIHQVLKGGSHYLAARLQEKIKHYP